MDLITNEEIKENNWITKIATQNKAINTNYLKTKIDCTSENCTSGRYVIEVEQLIT